MYLQQQAATALCQGPTADLKQVSSSRAGSEVSKHRFLKAVDCVAKVITMLSVQKFPS